MPCPFNPAPGNGPSITVDDLSHEDMAQWRGQCADPFSFVAVDLDTLEQTVQDW